MFKKNIYVPVWFVVFIISVSYAIMGLTIALITVPRLTNHLHSEELLAEPMQEIQQYERTFYQTNDEIEKVVISNGTTTDYVSGQDKAIEASYVVVHSGAKILVNKPSGGISTCTLTVISQDYGLTSGHCAETGGIVTAYNRHDRRAEIGLIVEDYMPNEKEQRDRDKNAVDVALIKLYDNVEGVQDAIINTYPSRGSSVSIMGQRSKGSQGNIVEEKDPSNKVRNVLLSNALIRSGDSGAPAYDSEGNIVGIAEYSYDSGESGITPMRDICKSIIRVSCDKDVVSANRETGGVFLR